MNTTFRVIGAAIYSFFHATLLNLLIAAIIFVIYKLTMQSTFWIIFCLLFFWWLIEVSRDFLFTLMTLPYAWMAQNKLGVLIIPTIVLILNALGGIVKIWTDDKVTSFGTMGIIFCLFLTYETYMRPSARQRE